VTGVQTCALPIFHPKSNRSYTYTDLYRLSGSLAAAFGELGCAPGDRVVLYLDSSPEYLISYFAIWRAGLVAVPANIVYRREELAYAIRDSGAKLLISSFSSRDITGSIQEICPDLTHIIEVGGDGAHSWENLTTSYAPLRPTPCSADQVCQIQYTSGTTGRPKGQLTWRMAQSSGAAEPSSVERCSCWDLPVGSWASHGTVSPDRRYIRDHGTVPS
jgi:long-chain acyl-CoA synthetase